MTISPSDGAADLQGDRARPLLEDALGELTKIVLSSEQSLGEVLEKVAVLTQRVIPELDEVSVTLMEDGRARSVVFTGSLAAYLDERQYAAGFGPCMDAAESGHTILVNTENHDGPYREFARAAAGRGIRHSLSVGLPVPQRMVGALNMYSASAEAPSPNSVRLAEEFATYAGVAVANAGAYHTAVDLVRGLQRAIQSRAGIEQAKGVLMAHRHCSADEAFYLLTQASQRQNRKLRDVAADLVAGVQSRTSL